MNEKQKIGILFFAGPVLVLIALLLSNFLCGSTRDCYGVGFLVPLLALPGVVASFILTPYSLYTLFFNSALLSEEHKIVGQIFLGPIILALAVLLERLDCAGIACDAGGFLFIGILLLMGVGITLFGIPKGLKQLYNYLKGPKKA